MKNFTVLIIVFIAFQEAVFSQSCLPEGIGLGTQVQIDNFSVNYPNCTRIEGDVTIGEGNGITNLDGLSALTSIGGGLWIHYNPTLVSISGLQNITSIGGWFFLDENEGLTSLEGLENLDTIGGDLILQLNGSLTTIEALSGVNYIGGNISVSGNNSLINLIGLGNITSVEGTIDITGNESLSSLTGLEGITTINEFAGISVNSSLVSLAGLANLTSIGKDFRLGTGWGGNHSLINLTGLANLHSIGGNLWIIDNTSLTNLTGLDSLNSIGGYIEITDNTSLTSLNGMDNISAGTITDLEVYNNTLLSTCDVQSICEYLASPNGVIDIHANNGGCNSPQEVEDACLINVKEIATQESYFSIYPIPSSSTITIETPEITPKFQVSIFNLNGQEVIMKQISEPMTVIDISHLPQGLYFVKLTSDDTVKVLKIVKE